MSSNLEMINRALSILRGPGNIQEKLASAYRTELQYLGPEGLNEKMVYELETLNDELTKVEAAGDRDAIEMSANSLTDYEAQALIIKIRAIHEYLSSPDIS